MPKVLGLGDNVCDIYLHTGMMYPGGQALNFAVYASQLGAEADFMGVFGQDAIARYVQQILEQKGIGHSHCRSFPGENGFARVTLVEGDRMFMGSNRGGVIQEHPICLEPEDLDYLAGFDLIHTSNNGFTDELLSQLHPLRPFVSYDFSYRWNEEDRVKRVCPYIDFAFLSCGDLNQAQTQELCCKLHDEGCGMVTATRGSKGAVVFDGSRFYEQLPHLVEPVDTMGAGDSFAAALMVNILRGLEYEGKNIWSWADFRTALLPLALQAAAEFSAQTCLVQGAFGCGIPVPEGMRARLYEGAS